MKAVYFLFIAFFCASCADQKAKLSPFEDGDILFLASGSSDLAKAISESTKTKDSTDFFHVGIASVENNQVYVYHASSEKGVCKELFDSFATNKWGERFRVYQFRLKQEYKASISKALEKAPGYVGQPYNFTYILEDTGMYCSEYVYVLFEGDGVFHLNPMHFTALDSDSILPAWTKYYADMGIAVPEGKPGCNPNGMAAEESLEFITKW